MTCLYGECITGILGCNCALAQRNEGNSVSYLEDSIDWQAVEFIDKWLDQNVSTAYLSEPLAQDWARIAKIQEELGEAIQAFIGMTGQNPRKGFTHTEKEVLDELADTLITTILAMQHMTKDTALVRTIIKVKLAKIERRAHDNTMERNAK